MQHSLLPLLLLSSVAVCSTNELPFLNRFELEKFFEEQDNENNINDRLENRDMEKIMFKQQLNRHPLLKPKISNLIYEKEENGDDNILNEMKKYNTDDFNERLEYLKDINRLDAQFDIKSKASKESCCHNIKESSKRGIESDINKIDLIQFENPNNNYDGIVTISPLLILKIRLSYLNNNVKDIPPKLKPNSEMLPLDLMTKNREESEELNKILQNEIDSSIDEVNREEDNDFEPSDSSSDKNKMVVKKRIFSLWSRLQGLTHRGHELHHRRHLYAFYGLPDEGGGSDGGALTAETRATFMRPPGSPLRWG